MGLINPQAIAHYIDRPTDFVEDCVFTGPISKTRANISLSNDQRKILNALAKNTMVAVRSGRGIGKTATLAMIVVWFMFTRPNARVICTGPKFEQLKNTLWAEVSKWLNGSLIKEYMKWTTERLYHVSNPAGWYSLIATAKDKENISGYHEEHMLFIIDEGSGVNDEIFETILNSMTGDDNRIITTGNPTQVTGFFYDAFHRDKKLWKCLHFNSEKSPLVSRVSINRMADKWGTNHDIYRVNVLGEFPRGNPEAFIQLADAEAARLREVDPDGTVEIGFDVARYGDDLSVVTVRQGLHVFPQEIKERASIVENAKFVADVARKYRMKLAYDDKIYIKVDDTGLGGGVTDVLRESPDFKDDNFEIVPIVFSRKGFEFYCDVASYMWGYLKDRLHNMQLPDDDSLIEEISARRFRTETGKIRIEPKTDFKREFGASPDRSDSLVLCMVEGIGEKKVISTYDRRDQARRSSFDVDWAKVLTRKSLHYGAIAQLKDSSCRFLGALWDNIDAHLYIYKEGAHNTSVPDHVACALSQVLQTKNYDVARVVANEEMFPKDKRSIGKLINREMMKYVGELRIRPVKRFDLHGAVGLVTQLFANDRITIHESCENFIREVESWVVEKDVTKLENRGYCSCLLMLVNTIRRAVPFMPQLIAPNEYSRPSNRSLIVEHKKNDKIEVREPDKEQSYHPYMGKIGT